MEWVAIQDRYRGVDTFVQASEENLSVDCWELNCTKWYIKHGEKTYFSYHFGSQIAVCSSNDFIAGCIQGAYGGRGQRLDHLRWPTSHSWWQWWKCIWPKPRGN